MCIRSLGTEEERLKLPITMFVSWFYFFPLEFKAVEPEFYRKFMCACAIIFMEILGNSAFEFRYSFYWVF